MNVDVAFVGADKDRLKKSLGGSLDPTEIAELIAAVGAQQMLDQATGKVMLTSLTELRAHAVFLLLKLGLPEKDLETVAATTFKIPTSSARRLIEISFARFDSDLQPVIQQAAKATLAGADKGEGGKVIEWKILASSALIRKWIQRQLDGTSYENPRRPGRGSMMTLSDRTYQYLKKCAA
ncbi:hypothetical protein GCM10009839_58770 [Catenulispora yoronensis]|uniref:DUF222 domain-containing protein n=1 Tax=Catenulispora yoronensis TaxID=450799 RepID=A0ABN2UZ68_9ACTN